MGVKGQDMRAEGRGDWRHDFDEAAEGAQCGLSPEVAREIWDRVSAETNDKNAALARFREVATRVRRRGGQLHQTVGKQTLVETELSGEPGDVFHEIAPGKRTRVEMEATRLAGPTPREPMPGFDFVNALKRPTGGPKSGEDAREDADARETESSHRVDAALPLVARAAAALDIAAPPARMDEHARARTEAHHTNAVMSERTILLHPERFDPTADGALETIGHEVAHIAQLDVEPPRAEEHREQDAESEASASAAQIAAGVKPNRPAVRLTAREAANRDPNAAPGTPVVRLDKAAEAQELRTAILRKDTAWILAVLERNAHPEHMYALCRAFGPGLANRLEYELKGADWARARVFLGEQVSFDRQLAAHDKAAIFRDLSQLPDQRALDLFSGVPSGTFVIVGPAPTPPNSPAPTHAPEPTTLAQVQEVLRGKLSSDEFYKAMRLLLEKAERAVAASRAREGKDPHGAQDLASDTGDLAVQPGDPNGGLLPLVLGSGFDPISDARIALAEERIRAADAAGPTGDSQALLAIADLSPKQRKALGMRLRNPPLKSGSLGGELDQLVAMSDDAAMIQQAMQRAVQIAQVRGQVLKGPGLDAAIERAGVLVREARARLERLPVTAPDEERRKAQEEITRLERMFFGETPEGTWVRTALENETANDPDRDPGLYAQKLRAMGADPVTVGREMLRRTSLAEFEQFAAALKAIKPEHRAPALEACGKLADIYSFPMVDDQRELLIALIEQGRQADLGPLPPGDAGSMRVTVPGASALSPDATIALHDMLGWMDRGPGAAYLVLSRLQGLSLAERTAVVGEPRFLAKVRALPEGEEKSDERDFRDTLLKIASDPAGVPTAIANYPGPGSDGSPWHSVKLEELRTTSERTGHANMRRAYVLKQRIERDPSLATQLTPDDRAAIDALDKYRAETKYLDDSKKSQADEIVFGQPQLVDTADAAVDPNIEAAYMLTRLREKAKVPDGKSLSETGARPDIAEALAQFNTLYEQVRPGGVSSADLARLVEAYYRADRAIDEDSAAKAENEGLAKLAATVAGVVVAVTVTAATGGALAPVAVAALAGISAGTAAAVAGASVRWEDTTGSVLRDFGTGAVEGVATAAGAGLAARIVRGTSAGMAAGRAAVEVGSHAAARSGGSLAAKVAEMAIDGAVGGAAGDLFQTATDEATWERGVTEAIAKMLIAIARGGAMGAVAGGGLGALGAGLGKLAARAGDDVARGVGSLLDESGAGRQVLDAIADKPSELDDLARAYHLVESGNVREAEHVIHGIDGIKPKDRELLITAARVRGEMRATGALEGVEVDGTVVMPRILDEKEFRKIARDPRADAMFTVENGSPQIFVRRGAPSSAIREEVTHLKQWQTDITMRQRMERISEEKLADWDQLPQQDKLARHIDKLEVEADGQRQIIAQLEDAASEDPDTAIALMDAEETLANLRERLDELRPFTGARWIDEKKLGIAERPQMFAKGAQTPPKVEGVWAARARASIGKRIDDPEVQRKLNRLGYRIVREKGNGDITGIARNSTKRAKLPHLQLESDAEGHQIVKEGVGRASFAEQKADAASKWAGSQQDLKRLRQQLDRNELDGEQAVLAQQKLQKSGWHFRAEIEARIYAGQIDEGGAELVAKWGQCILALESKSATGGGTRYTMDFFLQQLPQPPITAAKIDQFRRLVRTSSLDYIESLPLPRDRTKALNDMLDIQPDSGSKGELFHSFRERFTKAENDAFTDPEVKPGTFSGKDLANRRTPDDVLDARDLDGILPPGRYAIDDKAGKGAFNIKQALDYGKRSDPNIARRPGPHTKAGETGGFKLSPDSKSAEYDGLVYICSRRSEAQHAFDEMESEPTLKPILGQHPGGIHVVYFNLEGQLQRWQP